MSEISVATEYMINDVQYVRSCLIAARGCLMQMDDSIADEAVECIDKADLRLNRLEAGMRQDLDSIGFENTMGKGLFACAIDCRRRYVPFESLEEERRKALTFGFHSVGFVFLDGDQEECEKYMQEKWDNLSPNDKQWYLENPASHFALRDAAMDFRTVRDWAQESRDIIAYRKKFE